MGSNLTFELIHSDCSIRVYPLFFGHPLGVLLVLKTFNMLVRVTGP